MKEKMRSGVFLLVAVVVVAISPAAGGERTLPATHEAIALGIDHYEVSFVEARPHLLLIGERGQPLGTVVIDWGEKPHEQLLEFSGPDGARIAIRWSPLEGEFALEDLRTGESGRRQLRDGEWVSDATSAELIEAHERVIGLASSAVADYLRSVRRRVEPPLEDSVELHPRGPSPEVSPGGSAGD